MRIETQAETNASRWASEADKRGRPFAAADTVPGRRGDEELRTGDMRTSISIAMATYNGEKFLREQLESLAHQTRLPLELVVCDDCSSDKTVEILREFAASAPFPVRLHRNEANLGYSDNFFKAAGLCRGEWIAFCDQDDVWLPNKLARVSQAISGVPGDELMLVAHTSLIADENLEPTGQRAPNFRRDVRMPRAGRFAAFCIVGFSLVCRATLVREIDPASRPVSYWGEGRRPTGHDDWISVLANALGDSIYISEPLAIWRRHRQSMTSLDFISRTVWAEENLKGKVRASLASVKSEPYRLLGKVLSANAGAFAKLSETVKREKLKARLASAASGNAALAQKLLRRAEMYDCATPIQRLRALMRLLASNAYSGPKYCSLGLKSFAKDLAFALGVIG
ncbi:glycosyltransferase family 2 protein [Methylocystis heyeri]|uniref:Glycosyltransferase n=1 Tax=Methylocystis heyeri TaxID=391905 RepID=A0A6B8KC55_9HYPH|nr:glycosyltransferase family 2 protein [Methylocystis heyeri]QGM45247.1 glycosyltransferase [Methylocystis heyeri]